MMPVVDGMVSVVIPVFNRMDWVEEALQSVLQQTHSTLEILLCDDGSDSETASALDRLVELDSSRICVLHLPHRGAGSSREAGRRAARGEFIQYLDSDDRLHPEKFERQIDALRAHPECGIAYGRTRLIDPDGKVIKESYKRIQEKEFLFPGLLVDRWWCTHTPLYRREVCDRIGAWTDLRYSQDWEYDARAGALKTKLIYVDAVVSDHRTHRDSVHQTGQGQWLVPTDQVRFFQSLYACSQTAGVSSVSPEMQHFVRWVFACARSAGRAGELDSAKQLMALAEKANAGHCRDLVAYKWAVKWVGWHVIDRLINGLHWMLRRKSGRHTQPQSWMGGANESFS